MPLAQSSYQVRFEWGSAGLARLAPADVIIVVDVMPFSSTVTDAVDAGAAPTLDSITEWAPDGVAVAAAAAGTGAEVLIGCLRNASAVARTVLTLQDRRQERTSVAVIAAGERTDAGDLRFAVEDLLGAGAIIAAVSDLGADHTSPEAAAAGESARGLRRAMRHLLTASGSARAFAADSSGTARIAASGLVPTTFAAAAELDATEVVPVLRDGIFVPFH